MSERKESSVLFSLRELQTIEEERVQEEADAVTRAEAAAMQAKADAERKIRDEEEARRQAAELAERQAREAAEQRQREEQMRLEETERRARVEAQALIEQQRLAKEMELRHIEAKRKKPAWIIAAVGVAILVVGLVIFFKNQAENAAEQKKAEIERLAAVKKIETEMKLAQIDIDNAQKKMDEAFADLEAAQNEADRAAAIQARKDAKTELAAKRDELQRLREKAANAAKAKAKAKRKKDKATVDRCAKSSDPLCGL
tara:strand:+ start:66536 stop:67306 length:771 start_codon:yes stop_codon:yes gene_type:complete